MESFTKQKNFFLLHFLKQAEEGNPNTSNL